MLVLSRQLNESIFLGDDIVITVVGIRGDKVRLGIQCPKDVLILRQELVDPKPRPTVREHREQQEESA